MTPQQEQQSAATTTASQTLLDTIVAESAREQARVAARYKPVLSIQEMLDREQALAYLVEKIMREGVDYGWVPGTKPTAEPKPGEYIAKPTLFKAGAERACAFFGYYPCFSVEEEIEEWTDERYGEALFYYKYKCTLKKDGHPVGEGIGSGTTWESKHRYRKGERVCPGCGKAGSIIKGKAEYGGGWLCFGKKGGCGEKFADGDASIEGQHTDRVPNPDIADAINTVQKMAQKRAYVAATLTATGLSGRFTQDLEDLPALHEPEQPSQRPAPKTAPPVVNGSGKKPAVAEQVPAAFLAINERIRDRASSDQVLGELIEQLERKIGADAASEQWLRVTMAHGVDAQNPIKSTGQAKRIAADLWRMIEKTPDPPPPPSGGFLGSDADLPDSLFPEARHAE